MSETQTRPPASRGRSATRGGRGGPRVGGRGGKHVNGDHKSQDVDAAVELGELGELKKQYISELGTLKELFVDWTDVDLLLALQETGGDLTTTIDRISEGNVSKFAEVPKGKDRARSKAKDPMSAAADSHATSGRSSRGRVHVEAPRVSRGGRPDRGRGGHRGGSRGGAHLASTEPRGVEANTSVPTSESNAWDTISSANKDQATTGKAVNEATDGSTINGPDAPRTKAAIDASAKPKTWASMFAPKPKPVIPKQEIKAPPSLEPEVPSLTSAATLEGIGAGTAAELPPETPHEDEVVNLAPSKDELTEDNVEHLPDDSISKPMTETAASQVGSTRDIGSAAGSVTPSGAPPQLLGRPALGGYATTALKATTGAGRTPSFQRRILEQREAVVMPSNDAVHRTSVQFGMMDLNGEALDVDEEREDAETRPQAPPQSPPSQPRASLPPAPRQAQTDAAIESLPTPRQAPGLPPAPTQHQQQQQSPSTGLGGLAQPSTQAAQGYNQFGRFGAQTGQAENSAPQPKSYDAFGQHSGPLDAYGSQSQAGMNHHQIGGQSTASNDYPSYYTADQRNAYQNYYSNPYNQHNTNLQQDTSGSQQKQAGTFGTASSEANFSSQAQQASSSSRFNEAQGSGQNTPAPGLGGGSQSQPQHLQQQQALGQGQYQNYNQQHHPYFQSPYYQSYVNYQQSYQGGYGGPYSGAKGAGMYGQGYGISPQQSSYEHSSSPANTGSFGQAGSLHREGGLGGSGSGLGDFNRSGSAQPGQTAQQTASGSLGGMGDMYGRSQSSYAGANTNHYGNQQSGQQPTADENIKSYGDSKVSGHNSAAIGQPGRPNSATNTQAGQAQSGPQSHQQGYGGYQHNYGQGNQYGGLGGLGNQSSGQNQGGFGGYGAYSNQYGSSYGRGGGWGNNFQTH